MVRPQGQRGTRKKQVRFLRFRFWIVLSIFIILMCVLVGRLIYLTVLDRSFLLNQGDSRYLRVMDIPAYRGMILDRTGEPLAVSTPVETIWVNPQDFPATDADILQLSLLLKLPSEQIKTLLQQHQNAQFVYLKRDVDPQLAKRVEALSIPGVYLMHGYHRFYPEGEVASQVVGFTNVDEDGQEGLELAYNDWLKGVPGKERVLRDRYGNMVAVLGEVRAAKPGHNLMLTIDRRIQFLAYRVLKETTEKYQAESGSVVVENVKTGEILAMVNQPSFNPNQRPKQEIGQFRNRAVTDTFEPGSTLKAFSIASVLVSGKYTPTDLINTHPGHWKIGKNEVKELRHHDYGVLTLTQILQKSSNVGVAKVILSLPPEYLARLLRQVGFGSLTQSGFPGESPGMLATPGEWQPFVLATLAFGYSISVTVLQLTQAYSIIANGGSRCIPTFIANRPPYCSRVLDARVSAEMLQMLKSVLASGGTGTAARVLGYSVAGKTGTAAIAKKKGGYDERHYTASFVGVAPANNPVLVVAVVVRDPKGQYNGGVVAAPAFSKIMSGALETLGIPPDMPTELPDAIEEGERPID
jgi:cell division protein FtsI (penicillin-binding protein 3)